jgi:uncharacterized protein YcbX
LSQRELPRMTLVRTLMVYDHLTLQAPDMDDLVLPPESASDAGLPVNIWRDECLARCVGSDADRWVSEFLQTECRQGNEVYFGQNQTHIGVGGLRPGMDVEVIA